MTLAAMQQDHYTNAADRNRLCNHCSNGNAVHTRDQT